MGAVTTDRRRGGGVRRVVPTMGTVASIVVHDEVPATIVDAAVDGVVAELERLEAMFSTYRADSVISAINRGERHPLDGPAEVIDVLDACTWLEQSSGGAFRARRPEPPYEIDPTGFVKGWATERAAGSLAAAGLAHWCVAVGGDLLVRGQAAGGRPWHVAVADPRPAGDVVAAFDLRDAAVATSGTAERGRHLWDGRTGRAADALASLTVLGPHLTWADALATAAFALGPDGVEWIEGLDGYEALAVDHAGALRVTSGLRLVADAA
jgi:thiamine biosynthesis lipoprotein